MKRTGLTVRPRKRCFFDEHVSCPGTCGGNEVFDYWIVVHFDQSHVVIAPAEYRNSCFIRVNGLSFLVFENIPWRSLKWMSIILSPRAFCWTSGPHLKFGSVSIVFSTAMGLQVFTSPSGRQRILRQRSLLLEWGGSPRSWSGKKTSVGRWTLHERWHSRHPHQVLMLIPSSGAMGIRVLIYPKRNWGLKSKHLIYWINFVIGS